MSELTMLSCQAWIDVNATCNLEFYRKRAEEIQTKKCDG